MKLLKKSSLRRNKVRNKLTTSLTPQMLPFTQREHLIQLLSLDLDGTLLDENKQVTPRTRRALDRLRNAGIHLAINSGRPFSGLREAMEQSGFCEGDFVISNTGSIIHQLGREEPIQQHTMTLKDFWTIREQITVPGVQVALGTPGDLYLVESEPNAAVRKEARTLKIQIRPIAEAPEDIVVSRVTLMGETDAVTQAFEQSQVLADRYRLERNETFFSELTHQDSGKGRALLHLADWLGLSHETVMAVGDGMNDREMIAAAGVGVAMANGVEDIRTMADLVIGDHREEGLAQFLETYFSIQV